MIDISAPIRSAADRFADFPALISDEAIITYSEQARLIKKMAGFLSRLKMQKNDRVAIIARPSVVYLLLLRALLEMKVVAIPLNPAFPKAIVTELFERLKPSIVVGDASLATDNYSVGSLVMPTLKELVQLDVEISTLPLLVATEEATIVLTSGSVTGPKAALLTWENHYHSAIGSNANIKLGPGDGWLLSLPLYHVSGLALQFRAMIAGAAVIVPPQGKTIVESLELFPVTHLSLVAAQLQGILRLGGACGSFRQLKAVLIGGGPSPRSLMTLGFKAGLPLFNSYGLTETASQVCATLPGDDAERLATSGKPLPHAQIRIAGSGEIMVRGKSVFKGYIHHASPIDHENWLATGDIGHFDDQGYLIVTGRKDNMFISGGENIFPEEIEAAILEIQEIDQVVVVPTASAKYGQRPVAFVKWRQGTIGNPNTLVEILVQKLPRFKVPEEFLKWPEELEQTGIKVDRKYFARYAKELKDTQDK